MAEGKAKQLKEASLSCEEGCCALRISIDSDSDGGSHSETEDDDDTSSRVSSPRDLTGLSSYVREGWLYFQHQMKSHTHFIFVTSSLQNLLSS